MRETDDDRSWQAGHGKPWTSKRDEQGRSNARHSCLVTALHSESRGGPGSAVLAHSSERVNSDSEGEASEVETQKTEAQCSCLLPQKPKEICDQKSVAIWQQQSTESSTKDVNLGTITDPLPWYKFSPLNGIRVKQKIHKRRKRIYESSCSRRRSQKLLIRTIYERAVRRRKEETSAVLLQSGLIWEWRPDSMECFCYLQKVQNYLANGKSQIWTKIWWIILRTNFTIWRADWTSPRTPRKIKQEFINLERNCHRIFLIGCALFAVRNLGRRYSNYWGWRIGRFGVIEINFIRMNAKEVLVTQRDEEFVFLVADGSAKLSRRDYEFQEPTLRRESTVRRENLSGESHGDREEFRPEE